MNYHLNGKGGTDPQRAFHGFYVAKTQDVSPEDRLHKTTALLSTVSSSTFNRHVCVTGISYRGETLSLRDERATKLGKRSDSTIRLEKNLIDSTDTPSSLCLNGRDTV